MVRSVFDTGRLLRIAWSIAVVSIIASGSVLPALRAEARATTADPSDWLVMLYQDGDDPILEQDILTDFNEAERVGSTDQVHIVSQIDRYKGGYKGMGDWSGAKRFEVTKDDDLSQIGSTEVADLGEVDMSRSETLVNFVTWAAGNYPAKKYALIMSDHGAGWPGGFSDGDAEDGAVPDAGNLTLEQEGLRLMWLKDIDQALGDARVKAGIDQFELIGLDACLMSQIEVYDMLAAHARYAVASEETEPALGWAYTAFLGALVADPSGTDGAKLGQVIVNSYVDQDQLIVDDGARREFVAREFEFSGNTTAKEIADEKRKGVTLAAVDLGAVSDVTKALDAFAAALSRSDRDAIGEARAYAQSYEHIFGRRIPSAFVDLASFAGLAMQNGSDEVNAAGETLLTAIKSAIVAEKHGSERPGSAGIAIYFPVKELFATGNNFDYTVIAARFAKDSRWADFLKAYHTGEPFVTSSGESVETPKAEVKPIDVSPLALSAETASLDKPVNIKTRITGNRLGFIYTFVGRLLTDQEALVIADEDYLVADQTKQLNGVDYPDWPEGDVDVDVDWTPKAFAISDGTNSVPALLSPEEYGDDTTSAAYSVSGIYTAADGTDPVYGVLVFRDDALESVWAYTGKTDVGPISEVSPEPGDTFTVLEVGIDLKEQSANEDFSREGGTLTFGDKSFVVIETPAPSGDYVVGFIAEDLDGQIYDQYEAVKVEND